MTSDDPLDLDAYLSRIGHAGALAPSRALLTTLHEAHAGAVPFENLDILLGRPIRLDLESLQAKLVAGRRGGYCFEQNTLFAAVLERLGFPLTRLAARVLAGAKAVRPRTHMLLRVELPEGPFLADVGFGGEGPIHPLPLSHGSETWIAGDGYRLREADGRWVLSGTLAGEWSDLYAFTLEPQYPIDYVMANHFTSTYPSSAFVQTLTAQRSWPGRRAILRNRDLTLRDGPTIRSETIRDPSHLLQVLSEVFSLEFPPGTRFPRPEF